MASPEIEQQQPQQPEVVQQVPTQVEIPPQVEQGQTQQPVQAVPAEPQQLIHPSGQVLAQPNPAPQDVADLPTFEVPEFTSEEQVEQYTHGDADNSITWKAVGLLRLIHAKAMHGVRIVFGQKQN